MKIGILTFHCAHNYGAVLQCYALKTSLTNLGFYAEVIDYRPQYLIEPYKIFNLSRFISRNPERLVKRSIKEILTIGKRPSRYKKFDDFINSYIKPDKTKCISDKYDIYIMGSDQIWNPKITNGFDPVFFGYFPFQKSNKKYISYAASMETQHLSSEQINYFTHALRNFDSISVREECLNNLLQPLTDSKIYTVIDPTLLLSQTVWEKICIKPQISKKYVLVYQVRENRQTQETALYIAKQLDSEVINLCAYPKWKSNKNIIQDASPCEFLGWIKYAQCIITTSFHGTAFSLIFNKPFYCIKLNDKSDSRSESILKKTGLEDRFIEVGSKVKFTPINYTISNDRILEMRNESISFLKNSIISK